MKHPMRSIQYWRVLAGSYGTLLLSALLLCFGSVPAARARAPMLPQAGAGLAMRVQVTQFSATASPWTISQILSPQVLTVHRATGEPAYLTVVVQRARQSSVTTYHLVGSISLFNSSADPIPIARITVQLTGGQRAAVTPLVPVVFSSPLHGNASVALPYAVDFHLNAVHQSGSAVQGLQVHAVVSVPGRRGLTMTGSIVPVILNLPLPHLLGPATPVLHTQLWITDTAAFGFQLGAHPSGTAIAATGVEFSTPLNVPTGGSQTFRMQLGMQTRQSAMARLIATSQITMGGTNITSCVGTGPCPRVGVVLIGGD